MTEFQDLPEDPFESDIDDDEQTTDSARSDSPADRLFDGNAEGPDVPELQSDYGLSRPWAIFCRGTLRAATGTGAPPIFEIVTGPAMGLMRIKGDDVSILGGGSDSEETNDTPSSSGAPPNVDLEDDG